MIVENDCLILQSDEPACYMLADLCRYSLNTIASIRENMAQSKSRRDLAMVSFTDGASLYC